MANKDFEFITREEKLDSETTRRSLTYWQDVWRRLKKNRLSMFGLVGLELGACQAAIKDWPEMDNPRTSAIVIINFSCVFSM